MTPEVEVLAEVPEPSWQAIRNMQRQLLMERDGRLGALSEIRGLRADQDVLRGQLETLVTQVCTLENANIRLQRILDDVTGENSQNKTMLGQIFVSRRWRWSSKIASIMGRV